MSQQTLKPRKPRGKALEETPLLKSLESDPASAIAAFVEESKTDWENNAPRDFKQVLEATDGTSPQ